ncbi:hypothetical protein GYMLUDRAFT_836184 [Collybiopsis luxurians FD-317 M1]|uniref:BTB domain-containing protein n=1 Tax=Collybiopsis luxurians FD-317 M1 TaxID=944289 RepID=A0A0D0BL86_9AGAR|nr:hypothetical protein GYMLUDRAFT_836184 [Collybiopsis luxurians FD-317 M1]
MFSDIDSPTTPFGLNRSAFSRPNSPKAFHYLSVVGPNPVLGPAEPPSSTGLSVSIPVTPERNGGGGGGGGGGGSVHGSQKATTTGSNTSTLLALPSIATRMKPSIDSIMGQCNEYYFDHPVPVVLFSVQGHLFKVHRYFLERDSLFLRGVLSTVQEPQSHPLEIHGVSSQEFKALLNFFYQGMYRENAVGTISESIDLLAAASALKFDRARELAIAAIDKALTSAASDASDESGESECPGAVDTIILAEKFGITKWLRPAYISLCKRQEPLSLTEAERMGSIEKVIKLMRAREEFLRENLGGDGSRATSPTLSLYPWSKSVHVQGLPRKLDARPTNPEHEAEKIVDRIFFSSGNEQ